MRPDAKQPPVSSRSHGAASAVHATLSQRNIYLAFTQLALVIVLLQVSPSSKFQEDLGLDSLDSVEVGAGLHDCDSAAICSKEVPSRAALDVKADCLFLAVPASHGLRDTAAVLLGSRNRVEASQAALLMSSSFCCRPAFASQPTARLLPLVMPEDFAYSAPARWSWLLRRSLPSRSQTARLTRSCQQAMPLSTSQPTHKPSDVAAA